MNSSTRTALAELNRAFYAQFAGDFARTRQSWPPGFSLILPYLVPAFNVLDLGCGNARLLSFLHGEGWRGRYLGVDSSARLLDIARSNASLLADVRAEFVQADLLDEAWTGQVSKTLQHTANGAEGGEDAPHSAGNDRRGGPYHPLWGPWPPGGAESHPASAVAVASLAVLHHIPGAAQRAHFLADVASLLPRGGVAVISTWQFLQAPRLARLIVPWSDAGIDETEVEPGDYLLAWGQGRAGRRYCAHIDETELGRLASQAGLAVVAAFYADGLEGDLNLYAVLATAR